MATYCPELDVVVYDQYRDGNVPAAMGNLPVLQHSFAVLPATIDELYFRADSACYEDQVSSSLDDTWRPPKQF